MRIGLGMSIVGGGYAPSEITYLSDVGGTPTAAYSVRKVVSDYSGSAIRVRESSGDTETDIGFVGQNLDEAALLAHCGANDGFVTKWYDQSGNGYDAVQGTAGSQPKIVSAGTVVKENGLPALDFDGGDDWFSISNDVMPTGNVASTFSIVNAVTSNSGKVIFARAYNWGSYYIDILAANAVSNASKARFNVGVSGVSETASFTQSTVDGEFVLLSSIYDGSQVVIYKDSVSGTEASFSSSITYDVNDLASIGVLRRTTNRAAHYNGTISEIVHFNSDKSSLRTAIEGNINGYYSIYP